VTAQLSAIKIYTHQPQGQQWLNKYAGCLPLFTCTLGFTETGLIEGISAAGATPSARQFTALADGEFLVKGVCPEYTYSLPPLKVGVSPTLITRAVLEKFNLPIYLFNAGLKYHPSVATINLGGKPAQCLSSGKALEISIVKHLYQQGLSWGEKLAQQAPSSYLILGECVVGGTTSALAVLTALGIKAEGKVNSSHPRCNHQQKLAIVNQGLAQAQLLAHHATVDPFTIVSAVGDPMQIFVAALALSASRQVGVMLAGGTQMLAVYALMQTLQATYYTQGNLTEVIVGTTRWVAEDNSGDTVGLAQLIGNIPLCATQLDFSQAHYSSLRAYEKGFVKEGVGAGGSAIASHLLGLTPLALMMEVETILSRLTMLTTGE
jgi:uncharacterized protein (TIGR00303 family)